jgi:hypothetical protein
VLVASVARRRRRRRAASPPAARVEPRARLQARLTDTSERRQAEARQGARTRTLSGVLVLASFLLVLMLALFT